MRSSLVRLCLSVGVVGSAACSSPRIAPLRGTPVTRSLPFTALSAGYQQVRFTWAYKERVFSAKGTGAARIAPPDSVRLDFFLENGSSGGYVILIGDSLAVPDRTDARRYLPPVPLLWGALGRVTVSGPDTIVHVDGDTLRAEIGNSPTWRITYGRDAPVRIERIAAGRLEESVERTDTTHVVYKYPKNGRSLTLTIGARTKESRFETGIWRP